MEDVFMAIVVVGLIFVGLPWVILHYVTKWKQGGSITNEDEHLLEELYATARRLDERMQTVERLVSHENPDWRPARLSAPEDRDEYAIDRIDQLMKERGRK